jgi:hypothetical protein
MAIPNGFIRTPDDYGLTLTLPNRKNRHMPKLIKLQVTQPNATLADIVKKSQIIYRCAVKQSNYKELTIKYDMLEDSILQALSHMKADDHVYDEYKEHMKESLKKRHKKRQSKKNRITLELGKVEKKHSDYLINHMHINKDEQEEAIYQNEKKRYENIIQNMKEEIEEIKRE